MSVTLTIMTVVSWLLLLLMVFLYERLDKRLSSLSILTDQLLQGQRALMRQVGAKVEDSEQVTKLRQLVAQGKVLEAQAEYRAWRGATHKEALLYIDTLRSESEASPKD